MPHSGAPVSGPHTGSLPTPQGEEPATPAASPPTGPLFIGSTPTGAIRAIGSNPETAPITLHPGDAMSNAKRVLYVVVLGALTALGPFTIDLYLPAFPILEAEFHTTSAAIQLTLTGTMLGFAVGQLLVGPLSDKVGRRVPLIAVTALHVLASIAAALAPTLLLLSITRVFMGFGAAAGGVVAMAIVRDLFGGKRLVIMLSRLALVSGVAPVIAPVIGSALLTVLPWQGIFWVLAAYGFVMLITVSIAIPETLPRARRNDRGATTVWQRYRMVLSDRVFLGVLTIGAMSFSGIFSYLSASPFLFQVTHGLSPQQYGLLFAVNSIGIVIGVQTSSRLAARFGPQWVLAFATAFQATAAVSIVVVDQLGGGLWGTVVPLFFFMLSCGFITPSVQVLALDRHGKAAGTAASLLGACNFGVAAIISPVAGWLSHLMGADGITATTMAAVMVACSIVGVVALWAIVRPRTVGLLNP